MDSIPREVTVSPAAMLGFTTRNQSNGISTPAGATTTEEEPTIVPRAPPGGSGGNQSSPPFHNHNNAASFQQQYGYLLSTDQEQREEASATTRINSQQHSNSHHQDSETTTTNSRILKKYHSSSAFGKVYQVLFDHPILAMYAWLLIGYIVVIATTETPDDRNCQRPGILAFLFLGFFFAHGVTLNGQTLYTLIAYMRPVDSWKPVSAIQMVVSAADVSLPREFRPHRPRREHSRKKGESFPIHVLYKVGGGSRENVNTTEQSSRGTPISEESWMAKSFSVNRHGSPCEKLLGINSGVTKLFREAVQQSGLGLVSSPRMASTSASCWIESSGGRDEMFRIRTPENQKKRERTMDGNHPDPVQNKVVKRQELVGAAIAFLVNGVVFLVLTLQEDMQSLSWRWWAYWGTCFIACATCICLMLVEKAYAIMLVAESAITTMVIIVIPHILYTFCVSSDRLHISRIAIAVVSIRAMTYGVIWACYRTWAKPVACLPLLLEDRSEEQPEYDPQDPDSFWSPWKAILLRHPLHPEGVDTTEIEVVMFERCRIPSQSSFSASRLHQQDGVLVV